jgi:hypothetical protein
VTLRHTRLGAVDVMRRPVPKGMMSPCGRLEASGAKAKNGVCYGAIGQEGLAVDESVEHVAGAATVMGLACASG